ncbi:Neurobeachin-like protein 2 [Aduncisulcus paluster]|uniref:Neurobeachin-like protein 2 n=1 Tax=Aduncisulcus paluster TaxID=2918883 RepID=A0ABQ5KPK9_9EUKA|nr:Neurobeachin-like protein 2 [Aduncisulcus paluster]
MRSVVRHCVVHLKDGEIERGRDVSSSSSSSKSAASQIKLEGVGGVCGICMRMCTMGILLGMDNEEKERRDRDKMRREERRRKKDAKKTGDDSSFGSSLSVLMPSSAMPSFSLVSMCIEQLHECVLNVHSEEKKYCTSVCSLFLLLLLSASSSTTSSLLLSSIQQLSAQSLSPLEYSSDREEDVVRSICEHTHLLSESVSDGVLEITKRALAECLREVRPNQTTYSPFYTKECFSIASRNSAKSGDAGSSDSTSTSIEAKGRNSTDSGSRTRASSASSDVHSSEKTASSSQSTTADTLFIFSLPPMISMKSVTVRRVNSVLKNHYADKYKQTLSSTDFKMDKLKHMLLSSSVVTSANFLSDQSTKYLIRSPTMTGDGRVLQLIQNPFGVSYTGLQKDSFIAECHKPDCDGKKKPRQERDETSISEVTNDHSNLVDVVRNLGISISDAPPPPPLDDSSSAVSTGGTADVGDKTNAFGTSQVFMCKLLRLGREYHGAIEVTESYLCFEGASERRVGKEKKELTIVVRCKMSSVNELNYKRIYLQNSGVEIVIEGGEVWLLNLTDPERRKLVKHILASPHATNITSKQLSWGISTLKKSNLTDMWVKGYISTFDYLMQLNRFASRSVHDISQYPVFPWVLKDYTSETLDLEDPSIYRDLSHPIAAQTEELREEVKAKYDMLSRSKCSDLPPFHWGSHYLPGGVVIYWLMRIEPFTQLHIELQEGTFDHADRLFNSFETSWFTATHNPSDLRELVPEFYYASDVLLNRNKLNFGRRSDGSMVDNVVLPPYARNAEHFISIHRRALEGEYVSKNINNWIDLIFGYKQRGQPAIDAHNVFFHLSYEGATDIQALPSHKREAVLSQIRHFGQIPFQLFTKPHPQRSCSHLKLPLLRSPHMSLHKKYQIISRSGSGLQSSKSSLRSASSSSLTPRTPMPFECIGGSSSGNVVWVGVNNSSNTIYCMNARGKVNVLAMKVFQAPASPSSVVMGSRVHLSTRSGLLGTSMWSARRFRPFVELKDRDEIESVHGQVSFLRQRHIPSTHTLFSPSNKRNNVMFCLFNHGKSIVCGGSCDCSIHILRLPSFSLSHKVYFHRDVVSCVHGEGTMFCVGSRDTSVSVWQISDDVFEKVDRVSVCVGHLEAVSAVYMSVGNDLVVSGDTGGCLMVFSLSSGALLHSMKVEGSINKIVMNEITGTIFVSTSALMLFVCSVNGYVIHSSTILEGIVDMQVSTNGEWVAVACGRGSIRVYDSLDFSRKPVLYRARFGHCIECLQLCYGDQLALCGTSSGYVLVFNLT